MLLKKTLFLFVFLLCYTPCFQGPFAIPRWHTSQQYGTLHRVSIWATFLYLQAVSPCPPCSTLCVSPRSAIGPAPRRSGYRFRSLEGGSHYGKLSAPRSITKVKKQVKYSHDCWHYRSVTSSHRACKCTQVDEQNEERVPSCMRKLLLGWREELRCAAKRRRASHHVSLLLFHSECGCGVYAAASLFQVNYITPSASAMIPHCPARCLNQPADSPGCLPQRLPPCWNPGTLPSPLQPGFLSRWCTQNSLLRPCLMSLHDFSSFPSLPWGKEHVQSHLK